MRVHVHLAHDRGRPWTRTRRVAVAGWTVDGAGTLRTGEALAAGFDAPASTWPKLIRAAYGEFAVVRHDPEAPSDTVAAVDRIRSTPLFYATHVDDLYLSDDAEWIAGRVTHRGVDPLAGAEFMLHGMATGRATLLPPIRQLRAGEVLRAGPGGWQVERGFTYAGSSSTPADRPAEEAALVEQGVAGIEAAFERLLRSTEGRPLVVPLSGGLDSRLVAAMLVRGGRMDTVCFSYGRRSSAESRLSARIAGRLGLDWTFVPYTNRAWQEWYHTPAYQQYRREASRLAAIEHEQDWPAVLTLKTQGRIAPDAVFVPGHSGDFLAGSHLPGAAFANAGAADPVDWIWDRYYRLWPRAALSDTIGDALRRRIAESLEHPGGPLPIREAVALYDRFGWQERQAKLIVNSLRAYEHHDFDWRLPLWDADLLAFWPYVPLALRRDKHLYRSVLARLLGPVVDLPTPPVRRRSFREKVYRSLDLGYHRYGMYMGATPLLTALGRRIGDLAVFDAPDVQALLDPVRRLPPQTRPLNALIAVHQLRDVVERYGMAAGERA